MNNQSHSWYVRGEGNQPAGPFTDEQLIQSLCVGRLMPSAVCWREGMPEWLPLEQVEPFASTIGPANRPRQSATAVPSSAPHPVAQSSRHARTDVGGRRYTRTAWFAWAITGGIAAICAAIVGLVFLANSQVPDAEDTIHADWGPPVRVAKNGTIFECGLKDGWYTDYQDFGEDEKRPFVIVYSYKNLGPREGPFWLADVHVYAVSTDKVEIKTDKGHIFPGLKYGPLVLGTEPQQGQVGGWRPKETSKIDETGESALVFQIPKDEVPTELITRGTLERTWQLPRVRFGFRMHTEFFGFLPKRPEDAVPGLIAALQYEERSVGASINRNKNDERRAALVTLAKIGPPAHDAVPAIVEVLLNDDWMDTREEAAKTLGAIGPAAKDALPALKEPLKESRPQYGGAYVYSLLAAAQDAIQKIGDVETVDAVEDEEDRGARSAIVRRDDTESSAVPKDEAARNNGFTPKAPIPPRPEPPKRDDHETNGLVERTRQKPTINKVPLRPEATEHARATDDATQVAESEPQPTGSLSGTWQAVSNQALFRIKDDETTVTIELISTNSREAFSGDLSREGKGKDDNVQEAAGGDDGPDSRSFTGTVLAMLKQDAPKRHTVRIRLWVIDNNHLGLRCFNWPDLDNQGKTTRTRIVNETLARQQ